MKHVQVVSYDYMRDSQLAIFGNVGNKTTNSFFLATVIADVFDQILSDSAGQFYNIDIRMIYIDCSILLLPRIILSNQELIQLALYPGLDLLVSLNLSFGC